MANFTQTLTAQINFFGDQSATKWGSPMVWGTDQWGYDSHTTGNFFQATKVTSVHNDNGPVFIDTTSSNKYLPGAFVNTMSFGQGSSQSEYLFTKNGYYYVLSGGATNDENATIPVYVAAASASNIWTQSASNAVSWVTQ